MNIITATLSGLMLLTGDRLAVPLNRLLKHYDHLAFDSPPVIGLADASPFTNQLGGLIYALEFHGIQASLAKTALSRLASANARLFGAVLAGFEALTANYKYCCNYGSDYGHDGPKGKG